MAKQAKCLNCRVRYVWKKEKPLYQFPRCGNCGHTLRPTNHLSSLPVMELEPITIQEAVHLFGKDFLYK
ncbi:MAG: hypothetical protein DRH11_12575 [Deltaproteobacteria bacterium]|nr:MAG: hypothetical protein DRH11_12575 [Deltaproteobacteria bacterium]